MMSVTGSIWSRKKQAIVLICLLLVAFFPSVLNAQANAQLLFDRANDRLKEGNYLDALVIYNDIEQTGARSGALFLNMALSYVQTDSLGKAKYYFMKASRFEETEEQAQTGLEYVEEQFSRQSAILPKLPWEQAVDWLRINVGASVLLAIAIILLNVGVFLFVGHWFLPEREKVLRLSGLNCSALALLLLLGSFYVQYVDSRYGEAVMIHRQANVLERPSSDAAVVSQAYEGYTFTVDQYESRNHPLWSYVRMSNGLYGWIPDSEIMIL